MAFTYDPSMAAYTDLNLCRLRVGDTNSEYPLFTDAEINAVLARCTVGGELDMDLAVGILEDTLSVAPIRVMQSRMSTSGGVAMIDELNNYASRSEVYLNGNS